jgi:hypothetical protein
VWVQVSVTRLPATVRPITHDAGPGDSGHGLDALLVDDQMEAEAWVKVSAVEPSVRPNDAGVFDERVGSSAASQTGAPPRTTNPRRRISDASVWAPPVCLPEIREGPLGGHT